MTDAHVRIPPCGTQSDSRLARVGFPVFAIFVPPIYAGRYERVTETKRGALEYVADTRM